MKSFRKITQLCVTSCVYRKGTQVEAVRFSVLSPLRICKCFQLLLTFLDGIGQLSLTEINLLMNHHDTVAETIQNDFLKKTLINKHISLSAPALASRKWLHPITRTRPKCNPSGASLGYKEKKAFYSNVRSGFFQIFTKKRYRDLWLERKPNQGPFTTWYWLINSSAFYPQNGCELGQLNPSGCHFIASHPLEKNDLQHPSTPVHHMHPPCKIQGAECFASFSKMPLDWTCTNLKKNMAMMGDLFSTSNRATGWPPEVFDKKKSQSRKIQSHIP